MESEKQLRIQKPLKKRWMNPKHLVRAVLRRTANYFELTENRNDLRYQQSYIGRQVRLHETVLEGNNSICDGCQFYGNVRIGYATTLGIQCVAHGPVSVRRFCQFASHASLYGTDHPVTHVTTYVNRRLCGGKVGEYVTQSEIIVGNDVWIGHGAIVLKGVRVGDGAIIGAGSVVTHNIPDYSIAVGNPARVVRKRFDDDVICLVRQLAWWNLPLRRIEELEDLFRVDVVLEKPRALKLLSDAIANTR